MNVGMMIPGWVQRFRWHCKSSL